jgi:hypothetical protein
VKAVSPGACRIDCRSGRLTPTGGNEGNHAQTGNPSCRDGDRCDTH